MLVGCRVAEGLARANLLPARSQVRILPCRYPLPHRAAYNRAWSAPDVGGIVRRKWGLGRLRGMEQALIGKLVYRITPARPSHYPAPAMKADRSLEIAGNAVPIAPGALVSV